MKRKTCDGPQKCLRDNKKSNRAEAPTLASTYFAAESREGEAEDLEEEETAAVLCLKSPKILGLVLSFCKAQELRQQRHVSRFFNVVATNRLLRVSSLQLEQYLEATKHQEESGGTRYKFFFLKPENIFHVKHVTSSNLDSLLLFTRLESVTFFNDFDGDTSDSSLRVSTTVNALYFGSRSTLGIFSKFNSPIDSLPSFIETLDMGKRFNRAVDNLPPCLNKLTFGYYFNQGVDHLPQTLTKLSFGHDFDQSVDHLPEGLVSVSFGYLFNHPVDHLPSSLKKVTLETSFNQKIDHLPFDLRSLILWSSNFDRSLDNLPPHLELFKVSRSSASVRPVDNLPASLRNLEMNNFKQSMNHLPSSLTVVHFGGGFNQCVDQLPSSLLTIQFGYCFNQPVDHLPSSLKKLIFGGAFNRAVDHLPPSLEWLNFGPNFNGRVDNLPPSLVWVGFCSKFKREIGNLPPNLKGVCFSKTSRFNGSLRHLPKNLLYLAMGKKFTGDLEGLPDSLLELRLCITYRPELLRRYISQNIDRSINTKVRLRKDLNDSTAKFQRTKELIKLANATNPDSKDPLHEITLSHYFKHNYQ